MSVKNDMKQLMGMEVVAMVDGQPLPYGRGSSEGQPRGWWWRALAVVVMVLASSPMVMGQSRQVPAAQQSRPIVIHSATVHTVSGETIENDGFVVFNAGVITEIGKGEPPRVLDAELVNASGLHVYPGLILTQTTIGLSETLSVPVTIDTTELGRFTPEVRAAVAVNPDSDLIPVARANGILTALVSPGGGLVSGRSSVMRLDGWTWESMTINAQAGMVVNWPRSDPPRARRGGPGAEEAEAPDMGRDIEAIEQFFDDAAAYIKARETDESVTTDLRFEAMRPVLAGHMPMIVSASTLGQIESAVAFAARRNLKLVIRGGNEADRAAALLKKHNVPVIITGIHRLPDRRHDAYDRPFTLPLALHEAGVKFAIAAGGEPAHERNLNHQAATAAAYGLPKDAALKAVTLWAAEIIGVGDRLGSLDAGKMATLIITDGDPLEITTNTLTAFIDGRRIDLTTRHTELHGKYREKFRQLGIIKD